jgi:DNA invertase Pin-like site-specific DNA recombinase
MDRLARNVDDILRIVLRETRRGVCIEFVKENSASPGKIRRWLI